MANLLEIKDLEKSYLKVGVNFGGSRVKILNGVNLTIESGSCVGLIGESGSGKSTLARLIMGLEKPDKGSILFEGLPAKQWIKNNKGKMSVVFQNISDRFRLWEHRITEAALPFRVSFLYKHKDFDYRVLQRIRAASAGYCASGRG